MNILLIEDETRLADALCQTLKRENYNAVARYDGESGLDEALTGNYNAVILDVMLPKKDGFSVLAAIRENKLTTPVLLLTAKTDIETRVKGLDLGANYYLSKPFEPKELLACIRAITRTAGETINDEPFFGDLVLQMSRGGIFCTSTGRFVKMSLKELQLLELLIKNQGMILEKELLFERVWGIDEDTEYNNVEVYISFLRKKIIFVGSSVKIRSTRGLGYSLTMEL